MKLLISILFVLSATVASIAQNAGSPNRDAVDFTGRWELTSRRVVEPRELEARTVQKQKFEMLISQSGDALRITETSRGANGDYSREVTYFLDGRGETNAGFTPNYRYKSKSRIKNKTLRIEAVLTITDLKLTNFRDEVWKLSDDGKTLTVESHSGSEQHRVGPTNLTNGRTIREVSKYRRID